MTDGHAHPGALELDDDVRQGLERMAARSASSAAELANEALRDLVRHDEALNASIARGLSDLEAGRSMDTDELRRRLEERRRRAGE